MNINNVKIKLLFFLIFALSVNGGEKKYNYNFKLFCYNALFFYYTDLIFFCIIGIRFIEIIAIIIIGNINQVPISIFLPIRIRLYTSPILIRGGTFSFIK